MKDTFTTDDYLEAIRREKGKRATTYPKILEKAKKSAVGGDAIFDKYLLLSRQNRALSNVLSAVQCPSILALAGNDYKQEMLSELMRELKMRKSYYPRLIYLDRNRKNPRMTQETANYEIAVWESLTRWFAKEFLGLDKLPPKRRKKKLIQCPKCQFDWSKQEIKEQKCAVCGYEKQ